jgi:hypothetical protein
VGLGLSIGLVNTTLSGALADLSIAFALLVTVLALSNYEREDPLASSSTTFLLWNTVWTNFAD